MEFSVTGSINCLCNSAEYLFFGMMQNKILVFDPDSFTQLQFIMTKRPPISMTIVDKQVLVCGLKNHAFTAINFKENFRQVGMSWNASGNDWIQVFAD